MDNPNAVEIRSRLASVAHVLERECARLGECDDVRLEGVLHAAAELRVEIAKAIPVFSDPGPNGGSPGKR